MTCSLVIWLQLGKKVNWLLLKLNRKLKKMFLSPRRELNPHVYMYVYIYIYRTEVQVKYLTNRTLLTCLYAAVNSIKTGTIPP